MSKAPHWPLREANYQQAFGNRLCWLSSLLCVLSHDTVEGDTDPEIRSMRLELARSLADDCIHAVDQIERESKDQPPLRRERKTEGGQA